MDRRMGWGLLGLIGIAVMYVDGSLLARGVTTWPQLLLLTTGGIMGLMAVAIAVGGCTRDLLRR